MASRKQRRLNEQERLRVVTLCSGIEAPIQALENQRIRFQHLVACDNNANVKRVGLRNFSPERYLDDVAQAPGQIPGHDLLVAGFPCQSFSLQGRGEGLLDSEGRGIVILYILRVLQLTMPKVVILENVAGLGMANHRPTLEAILELLRWISKGSLRYRVEWQVLDTKFFKIPQSRPRLYIVCVRSDCALERLSCFPWPTPSAESSRDIEAFLDPLPRGCPVNAAAKENWPRQSNKTLFRNWALTMAGLVTRGDRPFQKPFVLDIQGGTGTTAMYGCSPCLTARRAEENGHWISNRARFMSISEMMRLQGMSPERLVIPDGVGKREFKKMIGNSMSVNVLEAILAMIDRVAPSILAGCKTKQLEDKFSS